MTYGYLKPKGYAKQGFRSPFGRYGKQATAICKLCNQRLGGVSCRAHLMDEHKIRVNTKADTERYVSILEGPDARP